MIDRRSKARAGTHHPSELRFVRRWLLKIRTEGNRADKREALGRITIVDRSGTILGWVALSSLPRSSFLLSVYTTQRLFLRFYLSTAHPEAFSSDNPLRKSYPVRAFSGHKIRYVDSGTIQFTWFEIERLASRYSSRKLWLHTCYWIHDGIRRISFGTIHRLIVGENYCGHTCSGQKTNLYARVRIWVRSVQIKHGRLPSPIIISLSEALADERAIKTLIGFEFWSGVVPWTFRCEFSTAKFLAEQKSLKAQLKETERQEVEFNLACTQTCLIYMRFQLLNSRDPRGAKWEVCDGQAMHRV